MNGRIVGSVRIAASNDGGVLEIVSWMNGRATRASAPNVVERDEHPRLYLGRRRDLGGGVAERLDEAPELSGWVGEDARATGWRRSRAGCELADRLVERGPRAAIAFPNSTRLRWIASRVGSSNVPSTWSISTGSGRRGLSGIVAPSGIPSLEVPWLISRYLSPSAERERTITVESSGSSRTSSSSFRSSREGGSVLVLDRDDVLDQPHSDAADSTSLLGRSAFAFGTWAEMR